MYKNVADQKVIVYAYNRSTLTGHTGLTGTAIVIQISKDGGAFAALDDTGLTEVGSGFYAFDITATETNASIVAIRGTVATPNFIEIIPQIIHTQITNAPALATALAAVDIKVVAIAAKTTNLPASPAAVGSQMDLVNAPNATAITAIQSGLATPASIAAIDIDGVTLGDTIKLLLATGVGKAVIDLSAKTITYYKQDGLTVIYTLAYTGTTRTISYPA